MSGVAVAGAERASAGVAVAGAAYLAFDDFAEWGIRALVTTRAAGSFAAASDEPFAAVMDRWAALQRHLVPGADGRLATARQVHGVEVLAHGGGWRGWLRGPEADGHVAVDRGTALAVSVADCVPVYVAHPSGAVAMLHSGWRGTAGNILAVAVRRLADAGCRADALRVLVGPAICGECYEVSPDVHERLTGVAVERPTPVDLRAVIAGQARALGVRDVRAAALCTRCDNHLLYSHRAGDAGRLVGAIVADRA